MSENGFIFYYNFNFDRGDFMSFIDGIYIIKSHSFFAVSVIICLGVPIRNLPWIIIGILPQAISFMNA